MNSMDCEGPSGQDLRHIFGRLNEKPVFKNNIYSLRDADTKLSCIYHHLQVILINN